MIDESKFSAEDIQALDQIARETCELEITAA